MSDQKDRHRRGKELWRIWDALFFLSMFSIFEEINEAQSDDQKFKSLVYKWLICIVFVWIIFATVFWIVS